MEARFISRPLTRVDVRFVSHTRRRCERLEVRVQELLKTAWSLLIKKKKKPQKKQFQPRKLVYADLGVSLGSAFSSLSEVLWVRLASITKLETRGAVRWTRTPPLSLRRAADASHGRQNDAPVAPLQLRHELQVVADPETPDWLLLQKKGRETGAFPACRFHVGIVPIKAPPLLLLNCPLKRFSFSVFFAANKKNPSKANVGYL